MLWYATCTPASALGQTGQTQAVAHAVEFGAGHGVAMIQVGSGRLAAARAFHAHLRDHGVALAHSRDHEVSQSLYLRDPDGLLVEVYADGDPAVWAARPEAVATVRPLRVDWLD